MNVVTVKECMVMVRLLSDTLSLLKEADKRVVWEEHGLGRDFSDRVEALFERAERPNNLTDRQVIISAPHGNAQASASGSPENGASRQADGRGAPSWLIEKLREYADYRATADELSLILYRAADELEALSKE